MRLREGVSLAVVAVASSEAMNALTRELFTAARCADHAAVERLLLDPRVDLLARDERGRSASECVSVGNVSMDPEDVAALHGLARTLENATERVRHVQVLGAVSDELERQVRALVARVAPSPVDNGGGALSVTCSRGPDTGAPEAVWRLVIAGEYRGALPSADPPWALDAELRVVLDEHTGLRELARVRWVTT